MSYLYKGKSEKGKSEMTKRVSGRQSTPFVSFCRRMVLGAFALALAPADAKVEDWLPGPTTPQEEWRQLPLDAIRLGGVFGHRIDITVTNNLLKVDQDNTFLRPFRERRSTDGNRSTACR